MLTIIQVRLPYLTELMAAKDTLQAQQTNHTRQQAELLAAHQLERAATSVSQPMNIADLAVRTTMSDRDVENNCRIEKNLETVETPSAVEEVRELLVLYPTPYRPGMRLTGMKHKYSILYLRHDLLNYRDKVSWSQPDTTPIPAEHQRLNVSKNEKPGTVKVRVLANGLRD